MAEDPPEVFPPELICEIIAHCETSTLLQLRLVSRSVKTLVDISTRLEESLKDTRIKLCWLTLEEFVKTFPPSLPLSNFFIDLSPPWPFKWTPSIIHDTPEFYKDTPQLRNFVESFGPAIRKLGLSTMFCGTVNEELKFLKSLSNLEHLEIKLLRPLDRSEFSLKRAGLKVKLPSVPRGNPAMKRLEIDREIGSGEFLIEWIQSCPSLEVIKIPESGVAGDVGAAIYGRPARFLNDVQKNECHPYILRLGAEGHLRHLRQLDFNCRKIRMDECSQEDLNFLREMVTNKKIRLENVSNAFLRKVRHEVSQKTLEDFKNRIVSFDGTSDLLKDGGFINLVELSFVLPFCLERPVAVKWTVDFGTIRLPSLKKIKGLWDAVMVTRSPKSLDFLQSVFRPDEPRETVTELDLRVTSDCEAVKLGEQPLISLSYRLETTFPNLTVLDVALDDLRKRQLYEVIEGICRISLLEELSVTTSNGVPERAFLQSNSDESAIFLRLKNLKKLRLASSDGSKSWMGDRLLRLLSRMSLTHLHIVCEYGGGWQNTTSEGIKALLEGPFGRSILWAGLKALKGTGEDKAACLERLEMNCHKNRVASGLTSTSFQEFKASAEALDGRRGSFRDGGWIHYVLPFQDSS